jgi:hypothetical protein
VVIAFQTKGIEPTTQKDKNPVKVKTLSNQVMNIVSSLKRISPANVVDLFTTKSYVTDIPYSKTIPPVVAVLTTRDNFTKVVGSVLGHRLRFLPSVKPKF